MKCLPLCLAVRSRGINALLEPASRRLTWSRPMQQFVDAGEAAGIVTLVASNDKVPTSRRWKSDLAGPRRMKPDDIFWIASMTKPITAVSVAIRRRGSSPSTTRSRALPGFADLKMKDGDGSLVKPSCAITLRDLLTHTSGMSDVSRRDPHLTLEQTSRRIAAEPLIFSPAAAGVIRRPASTYRRVVEVVSRMPFDRFCRPACSMWDEGHELLDRQGDYARCAQLSVAGEEHAPRRPFLHTRR
jgi:CubicO group peptidase (beta-lactamase class C family)